MKDLKGKRESNLSQSLSWGSVLSFPTKCRLVDCEIFFFNAILLTQLVREITEGAAREEIWSFVNYLFFMFTSLIFGKKQQIRQGIM